MARKPLDEGFVPRPLERGVRPTTIKTPSEVQGGVCPTPTTGSGEKSVPQKTNGKPK